MSIQFIYCALHGLGRHDVPLSELCPLDLCLELVLAQDLGVLAIDLNSVEVVGVGKVVLSCFVLIVLQVKLWSGVVELSTAWD